MAAGYACMADGDPHGARWLLTSLDPPATFTSCDEDFPLMMIPVLAANLDTDPDKLYDLIKRHLDREAAKAAKAVKAAPVPPRPVCPECGSTTPDDDGDNIWDCDKCGAQFKVEPTADPVGQK